MLRIHFTGADLARVRVADRPDPMWEMVLSAQSLRSREGAAVFGDWRRRARGRLGGWAQPFLALTAPAAYFPDFLTPDHGTGPVEEAIETVLATPRSRLARELEIAAAYQRLPAYCGGLAAAEVSAVKRLGAAMRAYAQRLLQPYWQVIRAHVDADRALRSRAFLAGGCEGVLASLGPAVRWRPPVLEADYPVEQDLRLDGRGLLLVPSYFCWRRPISFAAPDLRPTLVYPVGHELLVRAAGELTALLGATRALVLRVVEDGCTTTELARRSGTSLPSASRHAAVLRDAGLIATQRHGGAVLHSLTPLGRALLTGR